MRRIAILLLFCLIFLGTIVNAAEYRVLVVPDSLANKPCLDAFIYEQSSEFFANQVINKLNLSGTIEAITVSEARDKLSKNPRLNIATRESLARFKKEYNVDYLNAKKLAQMFGVNKILLMTTSADAQNYFTRRTFWDVLNIPGAAVVDPAVKLSTYAVLLDTDRNVNLWEDTFYKTISACEYRMVANSLEPQTQQLEKIKDYSRMLGPQIATNVQQAIVPKAKLDRGNTIHYGPKDFDNIFTKKYRWYKHGAGEITNVTKTKYKDHKQRRAEKRAIKEEQKLQQMEQKRLEEEQRQQLNAEQENIKNIKEQVPQVEIKENIKTPEKPAVETKKPEVKQPVKKELNLVKEEYIESVKEEKTQEPPQLRYYQPTTRKIYHTTNTTINDI